MNIRKYLVTAPGETHTAWKPLALEECQNVKLLHLYNCQHGVNKLSARCYKLSARCKICNHLSMKNMQVIFSVFVCICVCICNFLDGGTRSKKNILWNFMNFMNWWFYFMNWWFYDFMKKKNGEVLIIDNHTSICPVTTLNEICQFFKNFFREFS